MNLPKGWITVRCGDVIDLRYGKGLIRENRKLGSVPVYGSNGIVGQHDEAVTSGPTIIVGRKGSVGEVHFSEDACWPIDTTYFVTDFGPFDSRFMFHLLRGLRLGDLDKSTAIPGLSREDAYALQLPLPPLAEQKRIVAKVEEVLARVNAARERLAKLPTILKRFRQSVLASACSGRLTTDWRDAHPDTEPAATLLDKISTTRAKQSVTARRSVVRDHQDDDESQQPLTELPASWVWCRAEQIATVGLGGTPSRKVPRYWGDGVPWISSGEVANCRISSAHESITTQGVDNSNAKLYPKGTVLIAMIGEGKTRGQTAILDIEACTNQNVAALVFDAGYIFSEYVWLWALGEYERHRSDGRGGNYPALNGQIVRGFLLPLAPYKEQEEIVRRVTSVFALADKIEARLAAGLMRADKLIQSTLAKAFRGELVPTEAELAKREGRDFESADQLLARIRAEKAAPSSKSARSRPTAPTKSSGGKNAESPPVEPKLSRGIYLSRGAIAAYAVDKLHLRLQFGRVQLEKIMYLAEAHLGLKLQGHPKRERFGPLDPYIYKLENLARGMKWFFTKGKKGEPTQYLPDSGIADRLTWAERMLGNRQAEFDRLLAAFATMNTEQAEIFATVYAAWNDFLIDGAKPSDGDIIDQVRNHWHDAKKRFPAKQLQTCIDWMRDHRFVPSGRGPHTTPGNPISSA
jgi:type I restriction enzyme, S subunit